MLIHPVVVPRTELGRWSLGLIVAFAGSLSFFVAAVWAGERGGDGFFDNMWLTGPMLLAYAAAVGATVTGLMAVFRKRERAVLVFLAALVGGLVTLFGILEVTNPH
ncbi:MAG: hypothetical protein OEZ14_01455 [Acidimicrobiia bacterium]|nr:hypothetical protein [Acidimicrobiia bacterium]MDH5519175.1 hypothetical protein [Acidimicrobiia bacterium]